MEEQAIVARIAAAFPGALVDASGQDCNFEVYVVSESFAGRTTLQRQQSILALFQDELKTGRLHALSVKARTPAERATASGLVQIRRSVEGTI